MSEREEVLLEPAFVLHSRPFRNTSSMLECLTLNHGRAGLVARGARNPRGRQRSLLQPFVPLRLSWIRRGELGNLTNAEAEPGAAALEGDALLAGFYVNELVLRLMARDDANSEIFSCYSACLAGLARTARPSRTLRLFELDLLQALGYGLELDREAEGGAPLAADRRYRFEIESGPRPVAGGDEDTGLDATYWGRELMSLRDRELGDSASLRAAKHLLARVLAQYLGDRPLKSRAVLRDVVELEGRR